MQKHFSSVWPMEFCLVDMRRNISMRALRIWYALVCLYCWCCSYSLIRLECFWKHKILFAVRRMHIFHMTDSIWTTFMRKRRIGRLTAPPPLLLPSVRVQFCVQGVQLLWNGHRLDQLASISAPVWWAVVSPTLGVMAQRYTNAMWLKWLSCIVCELTMCSFCSVHFRSLLSSFAAP